MSLNREAFFKAVPAPIVEEVKLPGDMGSVFVKQITVGQRDKLELSFQGKTSIPIRAGWIIACTVDENGKNLFTYNDVDKIENLPASAVEPILNAALKMNAVSSQDIDDLEKKLETTP